MNRDKMRALSFTAAWISRRPWGQAWDCQVQPNLYFSMYNGCSELFIFTFLVCRGKWYRFYAISCGSLHLSCNRRLRLSKKDIKSWN